MHFKTTSNYYNMTKPYALLCTQLYNMFINSNFTDKIACHLCTLWHKKLLQFPLDADKRWHCHITPFGCMVMVLNTVISLIFIVIKCSWFSWNSFFFGFLTCLNMWIIYKYPTHVHNFKPEFNYISLRWLWLVESSEYTTKFIPNKY